jgi:hypothetical protein
MDARKGFNVFVWLRRESGHPLTIGPEQAEQTVTG